VAAELLSRTLFEVEPDEALGAVRRQRQVGIDDLGFSLELPSTSLAAWCRLRRSQIERMALDGFQRERELWRADRYEPWSYERSILLGLAYPGHPWVQALSERVENISVERLRAWGRSLLAPDRLLLVLVGDLDEAQTWATLQATFGALPAGSTVDPGREWRSPQDPGTRRLQIASEGESRLLMAWRVPAASHADWMALQALTCLLQERLPSRVRDERKVARMLEVRLGIPESRGASLLQVEAIPAEGRGLAEVEEALRSEVLKLQAEPFTETDVVRAQRQLEAERSSLWNDAATLAKTLASAVILHGDWRKAYGEGHPALHSSALQIAIQQYLALSRSLTVLMEPDPLLAPRDALEARLGRTLTRMVKRTIDDPAQAERVVRETLRQLRMLSPAERQRTLQMLEAQVAETPVAP
ncbi:MAG: insulinase family protein, partial [Firmicutes bacterium]|nr:insulinase family protein [Bacillota bacterium]